ncbi:hypothetical protein HK099_000159 [Clydaea vesicula]|uniref:Myb-like, SWIRM and MPN domain-containing protein 1 n=1 Tax=Clydaea vesicula TaxID=447962 RepID=A0AAD5U4F4_9FUNG|nr:hypothetical protein HK099_000159 [Clydaea vesicula]
MDEIDDASRLLIEQMMAEETHYFGAPTVENKNSFSTSAGRKKKGKVASTRWTKEETEILKGALKVHGEDWQMISELFQGSRTPLQVKNRVNSLLQNGQLTKSEYSEVLDTVIQKIHSSHDVNNVEEDDENIVVGEEVERSEIQHSGIGNHEISNSPVSKKIKLDIDEEETPEVDILDDDEDESYPIKEMIVENFDFNGNSEEKSSDSETKEDDNLEDEYEEESDGENFKNDIVKSKFSQIKTNQVEKVLPKIVIDNSIIQDLEKEECKEFFTKEKHLKYKNKTPERYKLIRNHILSLWEKNKPKYVTKTSARKGQGDVNAISRVWAFLEKAEAINVNVVQKEKLVDPYYSPKGKISEMKASKKNQFLLSSITFSNNSKRLRRVKDDNGKWVDEKELEGKVIDHDELALKTLAEQEKLNLLLSSKIFTKKSKGNGDVDKEDVWNGLDPFHLVPLSKDLKSPFNVEIDKNALIYLDFHSHLATTEVIGLLGGNYDEINKILYVMESYPCRSTSTQVQCEMDPASEMKAREVFSSKGYVVVGWYHSHPTFIPNPSIRDIENQSAYQSLFRREDGIEPFIGIIVNPYQPLEEDTFNESQLISKFSFLGISENWNEKDEYRIPHALSINVKDSANIPDIQSFQHLKNLYYFNKNKDKLEKDISSESTKKELEELENFNFMEKNLIDLNEQFFHGYSKLDKLIFSLNYNFSSANKNDAEKIQFFEKLRKLF